MTKSRFVVFRDSKYGFTLKLPSWWKSYIVISRRYRPGDAEYGVYFRFKYKGKVYDEVLTVLVYRMSLKEWKEQGYDDSPVTFLTERDGNIFAYTLPEELPDAFLDKNKQDYDYKKFGRPIRLLQRMVNQDAPKIVKTLRLSCTTTRIRRRIGTRRGSLSRHGPLRSRMVWPLYRR